MLVGFVWDGGVEMKSDKFLDVCQKCGALCCKVGGPNFTEEEMKKVLDAGFEDYFFKVRSKIYELKSKRGRCPYLKKDNSCEIHGVKPILCVCHPVFPNFDGKAGYSLVECPLAKVMSGKEIDKCKRDADKVSAELMEAALDWGTIEDEEDRALVMKRFGRLGEVRDLG